MKWTLLLIVLLLPLLNATPIELELIPSETKIDIYVSNESHEFNAFDLTIQLPQGYEIVSLTPGPLFSGHCGSNWEWTKSTPTTFRLAAALLSNIAQGCGPLRASGPGLLYSIEIEGLDGHCPPILEATLAEGGIYVPVLFRSTCENFSTAIVPTSWGMMKDRYAY